jgi:GT2 family glycosyltransferase/glycosyltransferase involved in cell wall biosynthesis
VQLTWPSPDSSLGAGRGEVVVCIPVYGAHEHFVACLSSVIAHTPADVRVLICDDASPDERSAEFVRRLAEGGTDGSERAVAYLRRERNLGFPANVNGAFAMAAPADVVVLNSDCAVAEGWLDGLRAAAYSDSRIATATALTNHGSVVSVPGPGPRPSLPPEWTLDDAAAAVREASLRIRPRLPTVVGHCMWVRRDALELVGDFDLAFSPGYGEEVDFAQRCLHVGLAHVLADDVLVLHHGGGSFAENGRPNPVQDEHERILAARYPYYHDAVHELEADFTGPVARALGAARRALSGTSVLIDARILAGPMTGTQLQVLEVVGALARTGALRLGVIVPEQLGDYATRALQGMEGVRLVQARAAARGEVPRADVVHRPYQLRSDEDLAFLAPLGERLVVTNQDLISFGNPSYFQSAGRWEGYRSLTRAALAAADRVVFISEHARDEALAEDLLEPSRASVVLNGVDHTLGATAATPVAPRGVQALPPDAEAILCLGTDFRHKNRLFALRLVTELRVRHGWEGYLLFAGPHVSEGSSAPDEAELIAREPGLGGAVIDLAAVSENEKAWLYDRAGLVLYPTVYEGFGLVPFEAADHGTPCLWAPATSLAEVLPAEAAEIAPWDLSATAEHALALLRDPDRRERQRQTIRTAAQGLTWDAAAAALLEVYRQTCDAPAAPGGGLARRFGVMQPRMSSDAVRLVGPDGMLPPDLERPLLALASHRAVGAPVFGALRFGYRFGYVWARRLRGARRS